AGGQDAANQNPYPSLRAADGQRRQIGFGVHASKFDWCHSLLPHGFDGASWFLLGSTANSAAPESHPYLSRAAREPCRSACPDGVSECLRDPKAASASRFLLCRS